jgi:hypothetical protein
MRGKSENTIWEAFRKSGIRWVNRIDLCLKKNIEERGDKEDKAVLFVIF